MKPTSAVTMCGAALLCVALASLPTILASSTQQPSPSAGGQQPPPKGQMPILGRPTESTDQVPALNFEEYFIGSWNFEWNVPESPLGPAGPVKGTTTYKAIGGPFYQAHTTAEGPEGPFTIRERIAYHRENRTMTRWVVDSRGASYMALATVGGDLGGIYNVLYESEPFTYKGRTIRLKDAMRLMSPLNYRVASTIAVDGGRFTNYGTPWWQKQTAAR